jgi:hypothetical protein
MLFSSCQISLWTDLLQSEFRNNNLILNKMIASDPRSYTDARYEIFLAFLPFKWENIVTLNVCSTFISIGKEKIIQKYS